MGSRRSSQFIAAFALLSLLPLLGLAYFSVDIASRTVTSGAQARLTGMTGIGAAYVEGEMVGLADIVGVYARGATLTDAGADGDYAHYRLPEAISVLTDLQKVRPGIQYAAFVDPAGRERAIVPASPSVIGLDLSYRDWYAGAMHTNATYVSEAYAASIPGNPLVIGVASPVFSTSGQVLALLLVGYRLDAIQSLVSTLASSQGIALTVTDQRGTVVAQPGAPPTNLLATTDLVGVGAALHGESSIRQVQAGGVPYLRAYAPIPSIGWTISASIPLSVALAGVYQLQSFVWTVAALLAAISIAGLVLLGLLLRQQRRNESALAASEALRTKERVTASAVLSMNLVKDELMATVSHELRTPLASLVGFTELLVTRHYSEADQKRYLTIMLEEGRRLSALINDFLDLQRMESGKRPLALSLVDLKGLILRAVAAAEPADNAPIAIDIAEPLPTVWADASTITQVLANLLSNARKYSPAGGPIQVSARVVDGWVEVSVRDSGLGVPPEAIHRLFENFYRVDNSDRREITGTGLGLAISKRIVEGHGGKITIESAGLGQGACATFTLPIARNAAKTGDVLLVEDDAGFAHLLEAELATQGLSAVWAADAETAEKLMEQMSTRAIVLDLVLPDRPGEEFLAWLKRGRGTGLPVVVVTVKSLSPDEIQALHQAGVAAVLAKHDSGAKKAAALIARALGIKQRAA